MKTNIKKKAITITALSLALTIIAVVTIVIFAANSKAVINKLEAIGDGTVIVTPDTNVSSPMILFAAPSDMQTENGHKYYDLTASVNPEYAYNQAVDWTVAWKNASSAWATGKTVADYITVTPTSDGALTAKLMSSGLAFGEQVIVTVRSRDNSSAYATATVDYYGRITGCSSFAIKNGNTSVLTANNAAFTMSLKNASSSFTGFEFVPVIGTHTANDVFTYSFGFDFASDIDDYLAEAVDGYVDGYRTFVSGDDVDDDTWGISAFKLNGDFFESFYDLLEGDGLSDLIDLVADLALDSEPIFTIRVTATGSYSAYTQNFNVFIDPTTFGVTSVELADDSFGF